MALDQIDRKILSALQNNGRLTNQDLSAQVGLSASPCLRRLKQLEQDGYISRYVAIVEPRSLGLDITAFARVSLEQQDSKMLDAFERTVASWPEVMECYLMSGDTDYQLRVVTRSLADYEIFLRERLTKVPGVAKIQSSFAFRPVVYRTALPVGGLSG
ncbi:MAG: Lrp/AsnC family transcriptional regulator [Devosia sp.]|nr:Lrp/AsnC family transcriptional regulator [Devosia sp.]